MKIAAIVLFALLLLTLALVWLLTRIRYRITRSALQVRLLGVPLRRIPLDRIETVSKRRGSGWTECWHSTTRPAHRKLVIRRRRGWVRNVEITPRNRYAFRADLERAIERAGAHEEARRPENA